MILALLLIYNLFSVKADKLFVVSEDDCVVCRKLKPHLQELKKEGYNVHIFTLKEWQKIKPNDSPKIVLPTVMYIRNGKIIRYHRGGKTADYIRKFLKHD